MITAVTDSPTIYRPRPLVAAPTKSNAWQWQLRDAKGRWIQMGSNVVFMRNGQPVTGVVVGSPGPGRAAVKLPDGTVITAATSGLTVQSGPRPAKPQKATAKKSSGSPPRRGGSSGTGAKARIRRSNGGGSTSGTNEKRAESRSSDEDDELDDDRLRGADRASQSIESLIRQRAKAKGVKDPFDEGDEDRTRKPKTAAQKAKEKKQRAERARKDEASGKKAKPRKRKPLPKLTDAMAKQMNAVFREALADVREGQFGAAKSRLQDAYDKLEKISAPWLKKRMNFLIKGLTSIGGGITSAAAPFPAPAPLTAEGRHVRTPAGAAHYGQPIGTRITRDIVRPVVGRIVQRRSNGPFKPPPVSESRPCNPQTTMSMIPEQYRSVINNGGGTPDNPVHTSKGKYGVTIKQSDIEDHLRESIKAALNGTPVHPDVPPESLGRSKDWYRQSKQDTAEMLKQLVDAKNPDGSPRYPGAKDVSLRTALGVVAAMSPQMRWNQNIDHARRVIVAQLDHPDMPVEELKTQTKAGYFTNVEIGLKLLRGDDAALTGLKRQSFWNNLWNPDGDDHDVTLDGWMATALRLMGTTYKDDTPIGEDGALKWLYDETTKNYQPVVEGAGYVIMADAFRNVARELKMKPHELQAIYWTSLGGDVKRSMWEKPKAPKVVVR